MKKLILIFICLIISASAFAQSVNYQYPELNKFGSELSFYVNGEHLPQNNDLPSYIIEVSSTMSMYEAKARVSTFVNMYNDVYYYQSGIWTNILPNTPYAQSTKIVFNGRLLHTAFSTRTHKFIITDVTEWQ